MTVPLLATAAPARPGPGSITWRIQRERVLLLGWGRAILLQLAHPLVAAGVAEHSSFSDDPRANRGRLDRTLRAMLDLVFGVEDEAGGAAGRINSIHDRVNGRLDEATGAVPAGAPYSAHMPHLLLWVHATFVDSALLAYERFIGPLTAEERDRYCAESRFIGPQLGIPTEMLPTTHAELTGYMERMYAGGEIAVGDTGRHLGRRLLMARPARLVRGPLLTLLHLPTVGLLPPHLRAAYGLSWPRPHAWLLDAGGALCRRLLPFVPPVLRYWPPARRAAARTRHGAGPSS